ncbi:MAG: FtsX-like permease family protein [Bacteroidota bacterium]
MFKNYCKIAWRNLWNHKVSTIINLACLATGMACCILIIIHITDELSYNKFNTRYHDIYRIDWVKNNDGQITNAATTPISIGSSAIAEIPQLKELARLYQRSGAFETNDPVKNKPAQKKFQEQNVFFSDNDLFSIFSISFIQGNPLTALRAPNSVVITDETAKKYFGDTDPLGKFLYYDNKALLQVNGVVKKLPANSDLQFDFLISFETLFSVESPEISDFLKSNWTFNPVYTYCVVNPQNRGPVELLLNKVLKTHGDERTRKMNQVYLQPLKNVHLYSADIEGNPSTASINYLYMFGAIAFLILMIANVNFINLATAMAGTRSREIGLRKVLGADKRQLMAQFLGETLLLTVIALIISLLLTHVGLPLLNQLTNKQIIFQSWFNPKNITAFLCLFCFTGLVAGTYPAFFITRFKTVSALKGRSGETNNKNRLRKTLLVTQFTISIVLIIGAITIYQQLEYMRNKPLGFQKEQMLTVPIFGSGASSIGFGVDGAMRQRMNAFTNELIKHSRIKSVTAASAVPGQLYIQGLVIPQGFSEKDNIFVPWISVDYNFISTFGIPLVAGRDFSKKTGSDHLSAFIINESAVKAFGWKNPEHAIGKNIIRGDAANGKKGQVIGVVKDHHFNTLDQAMPSLIMDVSVPRFSQFAISIQPDHVPQTISFVKQKWNEFFPERIFEYSFLDQDISALYRSNENFSKITSYFAFVAIVLCCLGLFSLSSFLTLQRTREIGIRKVLGAGVRRILILLSADFLKLVLLSLLIASPLAWFLTHKWLQNYVYRVDVSWWVFLLAGALALAFSGLTVVLQSLGAALANPIKSLKTE